MMILKNLTKINLFRIFSITILIFFCGCSEEYIDSQQTYSNELGLDKIVDTFNKSSNLEIIPLWSKARKYNLDNKTFWEIPITNINNINLQKSTSLSFDHLLVTINDQNKIDFKKLHYFIKNDVLDTDEISNINYDNLFGFSGFLSVFDLNNRLLNSTRFINGKKLDVEFNIRENGPRTKNMPEDCETSTETITTLNTYYWLYTDGSIEIISQYYTYDTNTYENCTYGGGGGGSTGGETVIEEDTIVEIDNKLEGKAKCLEEKFTEGDNTFLKDLLEYFEGDSSEFNLEIRSTNHVYSSSLGKYVNGTTTFKNSEDKIYIKISTTKLSQMPAISAARTILHEYIHADIYRKLNTRTPSSVDLDFRTTFNQYANENHHEAMGLLYVEAMTQALKGYHKTALLGDYNYLSSINGGSIPDSFYESLAWQGLKNRDIDAYNDLPESKKIELQANLEEFYHISTKNCPED